MMKEYNFHASLQKDSLGVPNISITSTNERPSTATDKKKTGTTSELTALSTHLLVTVVARSTN